MKKEFLDFINYIAKDIPAGEVSSVGLEEDIIDIYNILSKNTSSKEILLEQACFLGTKQRIEKHLENNKLNEIRCRRRVRHQQFGVQAETHQAILHPHQSHGHQQGRVLGGPQQGEPHLHGGCQDPHQGVLHSATAS